MSESSPLAAPTDLFGAGQVRLNQVAMYNWGTFSGLHLADIHPGGTLITGVTGAGKTTAADALITLINGTKSANYNAAAAKESGEDRSLVTYIRGSYGSEADDDGEGSSRSVYKRPGATASLAQAQFRQDDGRTFTIGMMCWINGAGNAAKDVRRVYFTARRHIPAQEILGAAGDKGASGLKRYLESDVKSSPFERFAEYQASVRLVLSLENENAPALLARALGLKEIKDLTSLLRDLVLEPSEVPGAARAAIESFETLDNTHSRLVEAREQRQQLDALPGLRDERQTARDQHDAFTDAIRALPIHIAEQAVILVSALIVELEKDLSGLRAESERLITDKDNEQARLEGLQKAFNNEGGDRIEAVKQDLERSVRTLEQAIKSRSNYSKDVSDAGLEEALSSGDLETQIAEVESNSLNISELESSVKEKYDNENLSRVTAENRITALIGEIRDIESRKNSNVAPAFQRVRDEICQALNLDRDTLPFVAELIDVKQGEAEWRGAIERVLGFDKLNLLVPKGQYGNVRNYLNSHHLGLRVAIQRVDAVEDGTAEFMRDGFLKKLEWKKHPYREFLKHHMVRRDFHCVDSADAMANIEFCVTREGLIQRKRGQLDKDDSFKISDKSRWALGFSNQLVLTDRKDELKSQTHVHEEAKREAERLSGELITFGNQLKALELIARYSWDDIDVESTERQRESLKAEYDELLANSETLRDLEQSITKCKSSIKAMEVLRDEKYTAAGEAKNELSQHVKVRDEDIEAAHEGIEEASREMLESYFDPITADDLVMRDKMRSRRSQVLEQEKENRLQTVQRCDNAIISRLSTFSIRWPEVSQDWGTNKDESVDSYLAFHAKLIEEGLPELEDEFQALLNQQSSQSLTSLVSMIDNEHIEIEDRIEIINYVLQKTTFRENTYLRLGSKKITDISVNAVRNAVKAVREEMGRDDSESLYGAIKVVIELLRKHIDLKTKEAQRTLDPRHQLKFYAEEMYKDTNQRRDYLDSSAGKSGGEKESFAGIIIAASLAYVLAPDGSDRPVYSTVFLDEAFSNTSDAVARRVLEVFKQLHLHVNLITPMKNLNIAQDAAATLLIVQKNEESHESRLTELSWEKAEELYQEAGNMAQDKEDETIAVAT